MWFIGFISCKSSKKLFDVYDYLVMIVLVYSLVVIFLFFCDCSLYNTKNNSPRK